MLSFAAQQFERGLAGVSDASHVETLPVLSVAYAGALQILGRPDDASSLARRATDRFPDFCDGRAMVAALAFASGDRVSAIRLADDIFVAAGRSDGTGGELRCAALAAAGIQDADRVATWVQRSIASEQALQAWTRPRYGVSPRVAWRRRWFPWNRVAERPVVREAARALEDAVGSLRAQVEHALDGLLEASPQISS